MLRLMGRDSSANPTSASVSKHTADAFIQFFDKKVRDIRASTDGRPEPAASTACSSALHEFQLCSPADVRRIIMESPTKSCTLDPIPTFLLKEVIDLLLPFITAMVNASLREGQLPTSQKRAIITPLLKKPSLDPGDLKNYRPVSNLTFMSKIVEKLVSKQLTNFLQDNDLLPHLQSAYRRHHSTETALLRVISDIVTAMDNQRVTLLSLLDLSAAFDCVDHDILLRRLKTKFGRSGSVLAWIESFLSDRAQQVSYLGQLSSIIILLSGVPQGSVLGPLLFILYTAELFELIAKCGLTAHSYADDTQVYISARANDASAAVDSFTSCVSEIDDWMSNNRLKMNTDKTQLLWLGTRQQLAKVGIDRIRLGPANVQVSTSVSDLGITVDGQLKMNEHVDSVCRSCFFQLRQLRLIRGSLSTDAAKTLIHAFISSRLDYCNSLLYGVGDGLIRRLQSVQNAAARVVTGLRKFDHIGSALRQLHWLPVQQRIKFKVASLVYGCLRGTAPTYLASDCQAVASIPGRQHLRSAESGKLAVPRTHTVTGARSFAVCGPTIWNSLPSDLRMSSDYSSAVFRKKLKTYLFREL